MHFKTPVQYRRWKIKDPSPKKSPPTAGWQDWFFEKPDWWGAAEFIQIGGWRYQREPSSAEPEGGVVKKRRTKKGKTYSVTLQKTVEIPFCKKPIEILVTLDANPEGWEMLRDMALSHPEQLGKQIYLSFVLPVMEHSDFRQRESAALRDDAQRRYAAACKVYCQHWAREPRDTWPQAFRDTADEIKKASQHSNDSRYASKFHFKPDNLAYFLWRKRFSQLLKGRGHSGPQTVATFKSDWLQENPYVCPFKDILRRSNYTLTIDQLADDAFVIAPPKLKFLKILKPPV